MHIREAAGWSWVDLSRDWNNSAKSWTSSNWIEDHQQLGRPLTSISGDTGEDDPADCEAKHGSLQSLEGDETGVAPLATNTGDVTKLQGLGVDDNKAETDGHKPAQNRQHLM